MRVGIIGVHVVLYTTEPERLRAVFRDVFGWRHVDAGEGWLIFALPPGEVGVHPAEGKGEAGRHLFTLMCDDVRGTVASLRAKGLEVSGEPEDQGYGITTVLLLPGGCEVMLYEPRHRTTLPGP